MFWPLHYLFDLLILALLFWALITAILTGGALLLYGLLLIRRRVLCRR